MTRSIGIFVFDDVEPCFSVVTIGQSASPQRARAGLRVLPDQSFGRHSRVDVLIVPGGVVMAELGKPEVIEWIAKTAGQCELTTSVCTGAFLLAQAGLLTGKRATTHWEDMDELQAMFPQVRVQKQGRWVRDGNTVTSGGISAGIDMSLHLVEILVSRDLALRTARQMEYAWNEDA